MKKIGAQWIALLLCSLLIFPATVFAQYGGETTANADAGRYSYQVIAPYPKFQHNENCREDENGISIAVGNGLIHRVAKNGDESIHAFCVEPFNYHNTKETLYPTPINEFFQKRFTMDAAKAAQLERDFPLISFHGLGYLPRNDRTNDHYFATQYLLWEAMGITINPHHPTAFNQFYPALKQEIQRRIVTWPKNPSFIGKEHVVKSGQSITLSDSNAVLEMIMPYAGYQKGVMKTVENGIGVTWDGGNQLTISTANAKVGRAKLTFSFPKAEAAPILLKANAQSIMQVVEHIDHDPFVLELQVEPLTAKMRLTKTANQISTWEAFSKIGEKAVYRPVLEELPLAGASFEVRAAEDIQGSTGIIKKGTAVFRGNTDQNGQLISPPLVQGNYTVHELSAPQGYILDGSAKPLALKGKDGQIIDLQLQNRAEEYELSFTKLFQSAKSYSDEELVKATVFVLENLNDLAGKKQSLAAGNYVALASPIVDTLSISESSTNEAEVDKMFTTVMHLPSLGNYKLIEVNVPEGYQKMQEINYDLSKADAAEVIEPGLRRFTTGEALVNLPVPKETEVVSEETSAEESSIEETTNEDPTIEETSTEVTVVETEVLVSETLPATASEIELESTEPDPEISEETIGEDQYIEVEINPVLDENPQVVQNFAPVIEQEFVLPSVEDPQVEMKSIAPTVAPAQGDREVQVKGYTRLPRTGEQSHALKAILLAVLALSLLVIKKEYRLK